MEPLDAYQQAAVDHGDGPALVLAGPGSGKTRVIVERAARLHDDPADPGLLVLTFSRKAAAELRARIAARVRRSYASFPVTTFHAFCFSLLSRHMEHPPKLARAAERHTAAREALTAHAHLDLPPSRALETELLRFAALCDDYLTVPDHPLAPVRAAYVAALNERGLTDYGGLQREAIALLERDADVLDACRAAYRQILVDEYQDTDVAQERLLELLAGQHRNVFCVADEDQSIYGFRGAEIENALGFERRWTGATVYPLPTNYRSVPAVVTLAREVVARNVETHRPKELKPARDGAASLRGRTFRHAAEEADWVAREVARLRLEGTPPGNVAILVRSLRRLGPRLAWALRAHDLPFYAPLAPQLHPTADALVALLELAGPGRWEPRHERRALRTLASPLFDADPLELRPFQRERRTLYGALRDSGRFPDLFRALGAVRRQRTAGAAIYALWELLPHFRDLQARCRAGDAARADLDELDAVTALSDAANEFDGPPGEFAEAFARGELAAEEWLPAAPPPPDAVALLTVHQAKGLEWDAVFVCDLQEGRFPALGRGDGALFDRALFAARPLDPAARARRALVEERRLFYVALTRARTHVTLTATEEAREEAGRSLSRFYLEAEGHLEAPEETDAPVSAAEAEAVLRRLGGGGPGWRASAETASERPMLPDGGLWTSATGLAPYENCPLQFFLGSMLELVRPTGAPLVFGGVVHDVLEEYHDPERAEPLTLERLLDLGEKHWSLRAAEVTPKPLAEEHRRRLEEVLTRYWTLEVAPGLDAEVVAVEHRFRVTLDATTLSGRIDRVDRLRDGHLRLLDYKSGKPKSKDEAEEDLQLALYAVAAEEDEELRALGRVAEIVYLFPKEQAHGRVTRRGQTVTADLTEKTRERIRAIVADVVTERFDFSPEADCRYCDFVKICPRHTGQVPV